MSRTDINLRAAYGCGSATACEAAARMARAVDVLRCMVIMVMCIGNQKMVDRANGSFVEESSRSRDVVVFEAVRNVEFVGRVRVKERLVKTKEKAEEK